jgi:hypothetical protein
VPRGVVIGPGIRRFNSTGLKMEGCSMTIRMAFAACVMSAAAGCAAPQYDKPVGTFASATSDTQAALASYGRRAGDVQEEALRNKAAAAPYRVRSLAGECGPSSTRCRLVFYQQQGDPSPLYQPQGDGADAAPPPEPVTPLPRVVGLMASIAKYADSLKAITTSESADNVEKNAAAARGAVERMAALVPGGDGNSAGGNARPGFATLGWAKVYALRQAVSQADPVLARSENEYSGLMRQATEEIQAHMAEVVAARRAAFRKRNTRENLDNAVAAAEAYDAFLMNDARPDAVFQELVKAHANLNKALQSNNASPEALMEQMNAFQAHANRLARILGDLYKAQKT